MSTIEYTILQLQVERQLELTLQFYYLNHVVPMLTGIFLSIISIRNGSTFSIKTR